MHLSPLSTLSLLVVVFASVNTGECSLTSLSRDQLKDAPNAPTSELKGSPPGAGMQKGLEGMSGEVADATELGGAPVPVVMTMSEEALNNCSNEEKERLTKDLTLEQWSELFVKFGIKAKNDEEAQNVPAELLGLRHLSDAIKTVPDVLGCPVVYLERLVVLRRLMEDCWQKLLDKLPAYGENREFFKNTLPAFLKEMQQLPSFQGRILYTPDDALTRMSSLFEEKHIEALLCSLLYMCNFTENCNALEGLSKDFLSLTAKYMKRAVKIKKLYHIMESPQTLTGPLFQGVGDCVGVPLVLRLIVNLKVLVRDLQDPESMQVYREFSRALRETRNTMTPANKGFIYFLTDFLSWEIVSLAAKARGSIYYSVCKQAGMGEKAQSIITDIERITTLLQYGDSDMACEVTEGRGMIEICSTSFLASVLELEAASVESLLESTAEVSEKVSELIDTFLSVFLGGGEEAWACRLSKKMSKAYELWGSVARVPSRISDKKSVLLLLRCAGWTGEGICLILKIAALVEGFEDPLGLDQPTREDLVGYWREAKALIRISGMLLQLKQIEGSLELLEMAWGGEFMKRALDDILSGEIKILKERGVNFKPGQYHQFIDKLPGNPLVTIQPLKEFSDQVSSLLVGTLAAENVEKILSSLGSSAYDQFKALMRELFVPQPQTVGPRRSRLNNKRSKKQGRRA